MTPWTDPETGNRIDASRFADATVTLQPEPTVGEIYLSDLRQLIVETADMPDCATVHPSDGRIAVNHRIYAYADRTHEVDHAAVLALLTPDPDQPFMSTVDCGLMQPQPSPRDLTTRVLEFADELAGAPAGVDPVRLAERLRRLVMDTWVDERTDGPLVTDEPEDRAHDRAVADAMGAL
ncbi:MULTISPECIES: hypothetical protein [unclassified Nocardia]|uniref:hypothetical protein n=1 Tax=unclassified Nocardia TaxID=2637762 RepID=UPI00278C09C1|nr:MULTISPECIES: hypothetical protein [unclassified Nocardia]